MNDFSTIPAALSFLTTAAVLITVGWAALSDWHYWRIPNQLLAASTAAALMLAIFAADGITLRECLLGGLTGLAVFMPFYLMGGMGAGDVKLLGVVGLHMGWQATLHVALISALVGGVWAILLLFTRSQYGTWISHFAERGHLPDRLPEPRLNNHSRATLPYGVVLAIGTTLVLITIECYPYR